MRGAGCAWDGLVCCTLGAGDTLPDVYPFVNGAHAGVRLPALAYGPTRRQLTGLLPAAARRHFTFFVLGVLSSRTHTPSPAAWDSTLLRPGHRYCVVYCWHCGAFSVPQPHDAAAHRFLPCKRVLCLTALLTRGCLRTCTDTFARYLLALCDGATRHATAALPDAISLSLQLVERHCDEQL